MDPLTFFLIQTLLGTSITLALEKCIDWAARKVSEAREQELEDMRNKPLPATNYSLQTKEEILDHICQHTRELKKSSTHLRIVVSIKILALEFQWTTALLFTNMVDRDLQSQPEGDVQPHATTSQDIQSNDFCSEFPVPKDIQVSEIYPDRSALKNNPDSTTSTDNLASKDSLLFNTIKDAPELQDRAEIEP